MRKIMLALQIFAAVFAGFAATENYAKQPDVPLASVNFFGPFVLLGGNGSVNGAMMQSGRFCRCQSLGKTD